MTNYEIGWKTAWLDHHLYFNGAVFIEDWHGVQFGLPVVGTAGVISIYNAGSALSKGVESDLTWRIDRHLTFSTSGSYIHAYLTSDFCGFNASGNQDCSEGIAAPSGTDLPIQPISSSTRPCAMTSRSDRTTVSCRQQCSISRARAAG